MASQSSYVVSRPAAGKFTFSVQPASGSASYAIISILGFAPLAMILALVLGFLMKGMIGAVLGIGLAGLNSWVHDWGSIFTAGRHRRRSDISVAPEGLRVDGAEFPLASVAGFDVRAPAASLPRARVVYSQPSVVFVGEAKAVMVAMAAHNLSSAVESTFATGHQVGSGMRDAARQDHERRSFMVTMPVAGEAVPRVVAGGLSVACANALVTDLLAAMQNAEHFRQAGAADPTYEVPVSSGYSSQSAVGRAMTQIGIPQLLFFGVVGWVSPLLRLLKKKD